MGVIIIHENPRGCGRRRRGAYAVSRGGRDGELPMWVPIDPPIPRDGPQFRGVITIDVNQMLVERAEVLVGASAERKEHAIALAPEIAAWGMPYGMRLRTGICSAFGPDAFSRLALLDSDRLGRSLRALSALPLGKASGESAQTFSVWQEIVLDRSATYAKMLACLWRLWRDCPTQQRPKAVFWVQEAMKAINAPEDAEAVREDYYSKEVL